jgi:hypothetical protein
LHCRGREVYRWEGDVGRLSLPPFYRSGHPNNIHVGSFRSRYRIERLRLQLD